MKIKYKLLNIYHGFIKWVGPFYSGFNSFLSRYKFQTILLVLISFSILLVLNYIQKWGFDSFYNELRDKDKPFYIRNVAVVLAAIATAVFTWWKNVLNHKTTEIQESTRQDGIFAQAVGFLNESNDLTTRKAGVHMLKDLAMTSPKHAQKCIDMLCSLNETWMPKFLKDYPDFFEINPNFPNIKNLEEIKLKNTTDEADKNQFMCFCEETKIYKDNIALSQLVLQSVSEIIRHISTNINFKAPFDLQYKFLCAADLGNVDFEKFRLHLCGINLQSAFLWGGNLTSANLVNATLQHAHLESANLQSAYLSYANLMSTNLFDANMQFANLTHANLQSAELTYANLQKATLFAAKLQASDLSDVNLQSADLSYTNLQNADLSQANLRAVNLRGAYLKDAHASRTDFRNTYDISEEFREKNKDVAIFTDEDYERHYPNGKLEE